MACSCNKKKSNQVSGIEDMPFMLMGGSVTGGIAGGYIEKMLMYEKDDSGKEKLIVDENNWRSDPVKRGGLIAALGVAALYFSMEMEDENVKDGVQGVGMGLATYGAYNVARETIFKDGDGVEATYAIAGQPFPNKYIAGSQPYANDSIANYELPNVSTAECMYNPEQKQPVYTPPVPVTNMEDTTAGGLIPGF